LLLTIVDRSPFDESPATVHEAFGTVRVLDLAHTLAGPYAALVLADLGCDVIKIEPPGTGDSSRHALGPREAWGESASFFAVNRNKRSMVLDLKSEAGLKAFHRLVLTADVVIENFRPGTTARLGIDYETLSERNPRLIYGSVSGFGSTGPYSQLGGYDIIAQGASGVMSVTGEPEGPPAKAGVPVTDVGAGLFCAIGILAALRMREVTGRGQHIDTSLFEAGIAYAVWEATEYWTTGGVPGPLGSAHRMTAPYQALRTADGFVTVGALNDRMWRATAEVLGHAEWPDDPRFTTGTDRMRNRSELIALVETVSGTWSSADLLAALQAAGIPAGPVNDYAEVFADPQTIARDMVIETEHPLAGTIRMIGPAWKMSELPMEVRRPPPLLGQHTEEVLRELGLSEDELSSALAASETPQ
jgi:crotonobetainyl-CoA:carnitine CoA-transferase CaiB-like acyl-CoA transferase